MDVNTRAVIAAGSEEEFRTLLHEYRPFIASCAHKATGRRIDAHDDAMSIAMIGFSEAVRRYRPELGNFLTFASKVMRSRLIDFIREEKRNPGTVPIDRLSDCRDESIAIDRKLAQSMAVPPQSRFDDPIKLEIDVLTAELAQFGIRFFDVAKCSPKAAKTKAACKHLAKLLSENTELLNEMMKSKQLPVQELKAATGVSRKTIGRHRNYIVCLTLMLSGEYECLAEYGNHD